MKEMIKRLQAKIMQTRLPPLFADEVLVSANIKAEQKEGKISEKEGFVSLIFVDRSNLQPITKIVLSKLTAKSLVNMLKNTIDQLEKELKKKSVPIRKKEENTQSYFG